MTTFAVYGYASSPQQPERATVRVGVVFTGPERGDVRDAALALHAEVLAEARLHVASGAATDWFADTVSIDSYSEYEKDSTVPVPRFRAQASVRVVFADFASLGDWTADLADRPGIAFSGIDWSLTDDTRTRVEREVRIASVKDAITKAHDYAAALGLGEPTLDRVYEEGLRPSAPSAPGGFGRTKQMAFLDTGGAPSFELSAEDIDVTASISADFSM